MADDATRNDDNPVVPTPDPDELTDQELSKVAGGGGVIQDRTAQKVTGEMQMNPSGMQMNPGAIAGWGDPH
jgi:hypothetical protein